MEARTSNAVGEGEALLAQLAIDPPPSLDSALLTCAALHCEGQSDLAIRVFRALRPFLPHPATLSGWPRIRLEILVELDWLWPYLKSDQPLFAALAQATLARDEHALDELVDARFRKERAPAPVWLQGAPHLHEAYAAAHEVPEKRRRIEQGVKSAILLTVCGILWELWENLPTLLKSLGFHPR